MKALVFEGPRSFSVQDRPTPVPGRGEALVRVAATGICGSDLHGYMGRTGRRAPGMIMGHEIVGWLEQLGPETALERDHDGPFAVTPVISCGECPACVQGEDNFCNVKRLVGVDADIIGGFAEFMVAPVRNLIPVGADIPIELGALVEPFAVGYRAAILADCKPDAPVLVVGGGTIGIAALVAARRLGADPVILSEPMKHRRDVAARMGGITVDPTNDNVTARVAELTDGAGVPSAIDCVGTSATVDAALQACAVKGTVVMVGMESPTIEVPLYPLVTAERRLIGDFGYTTQHFQETADWISENPPEIADYIEASVSLEEAGGRFEALGTNSDHSTKVVVIPDNTTS